MFMVLSICLAKSVIWRIHVSLSLKIKGEPNCWTTLHTELPFGEVSLPLQMPEEPCWKVLSVKWGSIVVVQTPCCFPI